VYDPSSKIKTIIIKRKIKKNITTYYFSTHGCCAGFKSFFDTEVGTFAKKLFMTGVVI